MVIWRVKCITYMYLYGVWCVRIKSTHFPFRNTYINLMWATAAVGKCSILNLFFQLAVYIVQWGMVWSISSGGGRKCTMLRTQPTTLLCVCVCGCIIGTTQYWCTTYTCINGPQLYTTTSTNIAYRRTRTHALKVHPLSNRALFQHYHPILV